MFTKGIKAYTDVGVTTAVTTANPVQLIVLLYDGAMSALATAKGEIERSNIPEKSRLIIKAIAIIEGLRSAIDFQQGGDIANNLEDLYQYMSLQLTTANLNNDTAPIDEVYRLLSELREAWQELALKNIGAPQVAAPSTNAVSTGGSPR
jgi:flagellar protein FliS